MASAFASVSLLSLCLLSSVLVAALPGLPQCPAADNSVPCRIFFDGCRFCPAPANGTLACPPRGPLDACVASGPAHCVALHRPPAADAPCELVWFGNQYCSQRGTDIVCPEVPASADWTAPRCVHMLDDEEDYEDEAQDDALDTDDDGDLMVKVCHFEPSAQTFRPIRVSQAWLAMPHGHFAQVARR